MNYSYKIHVINRDLNLDPTYKNVVQVFDPILKTKDYTSVFTNEELNFDATDSEINFNIKDGINASVTLDLQPSEDEEEQANILKQFGVTSVSMVDATNRQYAIVQEQESNDNGNITKTKLYFYFIENPTILNNNTVHYNLKLDVFMTYPLFSDIEINKTRISRAHVNRFASGSTLANATHNLDLKYLQTGEPLDDTFIKIRKEETPINFFNFMGTNYVQMGSIPVSKTTIENILNNTKWLYVMERHESQGGGDLEGNKLLIAPFLEKNPSTYDKIEFYLSPDIDYTNNGELISANFLYDEICESPTIYNAFISPLSPFGTLLNNISNYYIAYERISATQLNIIFVNNNKAYNNQRLNDTEVKSVIASNNSLNDPSACIAIMYTDDESIKNFVSYFESEELTIFSKNFTLTNTPYNYNVIENAEVKTKIRQCYNEINLKTALDTSELNVDLSILKTNKLKIKAINNLSGLTNVEIYLTINDENIKNYGIFTKAQYTPLIYSDKFNEYKATNKNYAITGQAIPIITGTIGGAVGGAMKGGIYGAILGGAVGFGTSAYKVHANYDNMKNSPDGIKLKGQNITIDEIAHNSMFYLENNKLRETDLKEVNTYLYENGYTINEIEEISNFFTRSSFNYIQLENCKKDLHALINENIIDTIVKALEEGVRFWTPTHYASDKFNYTTNNLEKTLL